MAEYKDESRDPYLYEGTDVLKIPGLVLAFSHPLHFIATIPRSRCVSAPWVGVASSPPVEKHFPLRAEIRLRMATAGQALG